MNENGRNIIMLFAGGYIGYLGIKLVGSVISGEETSLWFVLFGILFIVFAAGTFVFYLKQMRKQNAPLDMSEDLLEEDEVSDDEEASDETEAEVVAEPQIENQEDIPCE